LVDVDHEKRAVLDVNLTVKPAGLKQKLRRANETEGDMIAY
jgi:hypothetical protein